MMQKEQFQQYLYNQEIYKTADISGIKEVLKEYPWFSTASIILLVCSKLQSVPDFNQLLKKHSLNVPDRKVLGKLLYSGFDNPVEENDSQSGKEDSNELHPGTPDIPESNSRISGIFDTLEISDSVVEIQAERGIPSVLNDDSLLDFSYSAGKSESAVPELSAKAVSGSEEVHTINSSLSDEMPKSLSSDKNFDHWIEKLGGDSEVEKSPYKKHHIIESFIHSEPGVIRADKVTRIQGDVSKDSAEENEGFITDTLARIYVKQGLYNKAIYAYEKLCLKYPEKSIYFASQIEEIRNLYIKK